MNNEETYTCIFGGGAVRGFAYIGAIKALRELKFNCDTIVGSSVGAIFAAFIAVGYTYEEIIDIFIDVNFELFKDLNIGFGKQIAFSKGNVFTKWVRKYIEQKIYGENYKENNNKPVRFCDIDKDLLVYTTDLNSFKCKEFSKYETPDFEIAEAVRISCSMPGLMTPTEINGEKLVDGDLLKSKPLWKNSKNLKLGKNRILEFRLEGEYEKVDNNFFDFCNAIYSCMTSAATDHVIDCYGDRDDFDYIKLNTGDVIILDFNISDSMRNALIEIGYKQSIEKIIGDISKKKQNLITKYSDLSKRLGQIKNYIQLNNINKSKNLLGDLYIAYAEEKDIISVCVSDKLKEFKDMYMVASKGRGWFGTPKFKDRKNLLKLIEQVIYETDLRKTKLEHSINKIELLKPNIENIC